MLTDAVDGERFTVTYTDPQNLPIDDATVTVRDTGPDGTGGASTGAGDADREGDEIAGVGTDGPGEGAEAPVMAAAVAGIEVEVVTVDVGTAKLPTGCFGKVTAAWVGSAGIARTSCSR